MTDAPDGGRVRLDHHPRGSLQRAALRFGLLVALLVTVFALLRWTPLGDLLTAERLQELLAALRGAWWSPLALVGLFTVCGAVGVWRGQMEAMVEDIRTPSASSVAGEEPQSETPQGRTGLVRQGLERAVLATDDLVEGVANAGVPDTAGGEQAASQVSAWANGAQNDLEQAQDSLDEEAETLEEAIDQVAGAVRAIGTTLATGVQAIADAARDDPELADALEQSSTCQQLREEAGES